MADLRFNKIKTETHFYEVNTPFDATLYQDGDIVFVHNEGDTDLRLFVINNGVAEEVLAKAGGLGLELFTGDGNTKTVTIADAVEIYKSDAPGTFVGNTFEFNVAPAVGQIVKIFYYKDDTRFGTVIPDGYTITIDDKGVISATKIKPGIGLNFNANDPDALDVQLDNQSLKTTNDNKLYVDLDRVIDGDTIKKN